MEELISLGGIGRKTANVVPGNAFGIPGVMVDTHVKRVAYSLGLTSNQYPVRIKNDLLKLVFQKEWTQFFHLMIFTRRNICGAKKSLCDECVVENLGYKASAKKWDAQ